MMLDKLTGTDAARLDTFITFPRAKLEKVVIFQKYNNVLNKQRLLHG